MSSPYFHLTKAVGQAVIWATCYFALGRRSQAHPEWTARFLAIIHSLLVTGLSVLSFWVGPKPFENYGQPNTYFQELTMSTCLGFFSYEIFWYLYHHPNNKVMLTHHALGILSLGFVLTRGTSGCEVTAAIFCLELANPLLQARWFIHISKYKNTIVHTLNEVMFVGLFVVSRVLWLSYLGYLTLKHPQPTVYVKLFAIGFYVLSWVFIVEYFYRKYRKQSREKLLKEWNSKDNTYNLNLIREYTF